MIATIYYPEHKKTGHKPAVTWVLVMDSRRAQIFTKDLKAMSPILVPVLDKAFIAEPVEREVGRRALPRVHESVGEARHAIEPRIDIKHEAAKRFAQHVAGFLNEAQHKKQFDQLVLVAPKRLIGELRQTINGVEKTVIAEVPKELTHAPIGALSLYLAERSLL